MLRKERSLSVGIDSFTYELARTNHEMDGAFG